MVKKSNYIERAVNKYKAKKPLSQKALDARAHNFAIFQVAGARCALDKVWNSPKASPKAKHLAMQVDTYLIELKQELCKNNQVDS